METLSPALRHINKFCYLDGTFHPQLKLRLLENIQLIERAESDRHLQLVPFALLLYPLKKFEYVQEMRSYLGKGLYKKALSKSLTYNQALVSLWKDLPNSVVPLNIHGGTIRVHLHSGVLKGVIHPTVKIQEMGVDNFPERLRRVIDVPPYARRGIDSGEKEYIWAYDKIQNLSSAEWRGIKDLPRFFQNLYNLHRDTSTMLRLLNEAPDMAKWSVAHMNREHSRAIEAVRRKDRGVLSTEIFDNIEPTGIVGPFSLLRGDRATVQLLMCEVDYVAEGDKLHHCLGSSYVQFAKQGIYLAFNVKANDFEATLGLESHSPNEGYKIDQFRKAYNGPVKESQARYGEEIQRMVQTDYQQFFRRNFQ